MERSIGSLTRDPMNSSSKVYPLQPPQLNKEDEIKRCQCSPMIFASTVSASFSSCQLLHFCMKHLLSWEPTNKGSLQHQRLKDSPHPKSPRQWLTGLWYKCLLSLPFPERALKCPIGLSYFSNGKIKIQGPKETDHLMTYTRYWLHSLPTLLL